MNTKVRIKSLCFPESCQYVHALKSKHELFIFNDSYVTSVTMVLDYDSSCDYYLIY